MGADTRVGVVDDYRELPEGLAAAVAALIAAERSAHRDAHKCELCSRSATLNVRNAELGVLNAVRVCYLPAKVAKVA